MEKDIEQLVNLENLPVHVAIIMDGNRRWAKKNNLETAQGHKEGAENLKRIAKFANKIGIKYMKVKSRNCGSRQYSRIYGSIY